jgi:hypothetical protein
VSLQLEHDLNTEEHRFGFSAQASENQFVEIASYAFHTRLKIFEGSALLLEAGQVHRDSKSATGSRISRYGLLQAPIKATQGLYILGNLEFGKANLFGESSNLRWGPGIQIFPVQKMELRADLLNTQSYSVSNPAQSAWTFLFQTHVWL